MICRYKIVTLLLFLAMMASSVMAQSGDTNYKLSNGEPVGGGGRSTSTNYVAIGSVPLTGCLLSTSTGYAVIGGTIGISYSLPNMVLEISHTLTALRTVNFGAEQAISINIVAGDGADTSGTVYRRPVGQTAFTSSDMALNGSVLSFTIPGTELDVRGMEYYVRVVVDDDTAWVGESADPYVFVTTMTNAQGQRPTSLPDASYRIIGVPIAVSNHSIAAVFDDDLGTYDTKQWRLGRYDATDDTVYEHTDADQVYPGVGYWLIARGGKTYGSAGTCVRPNYDYGGGKYFSVALSQGWNMLANPFAFDITWDDVLFDDNGTIRVYNDVTVSDGQIYSYSGSSYSAASVIGDWEGVFVNILKTGVEVLIPCHNIVAGKIVPLHEAPVTKNNWAVDMKLELNGLSDDLNTVGVKPDASAGQDIHDYLEPPAAPDGPRMTFKISEADSRARRADFRPPFDDGAVWNINLEKAGGGVITFSGIENIPEGMNAMFRIGSRMNVLVDARTAITVPEGATAAQLIIGTEKYINGLNGMVLPEKFTLEQNIPNPFNPITNIHFTLPGPGHVRLEVFNILGQSVIVLNDEELPAGYHNTVWNGVDNGGTPVASGIYFYRIDYDNQNQTRKMLLLK